MLDAKSEAHNSQDSFNVMIARRHYISQLVRERCGSVVCYGILKGYPVPISRWSETVASSYLLGTYEPGVCAIIDRLKSPSKTLVDIGAADGVFGIGLVYTKAFGRSVCFEIDPTSQANIASHASALGIADKVTVHGPADASLYDTLVQSNIDLSNTIIICDVEGFEEYLFTEELLKKLSQCHIVIEVHHEDHIIDSFARRCEKYFNINRIQDGLRDVRNIPLIADFQDLDVYLSCSELRPTMMHWFWLSPKSEAPLNPDELDMLLLKYQREMFSQKTWQHSNSSLYCRGARREPNGVNFDAERDELQTYGPYAYLDRGIYEIILEFAKEGIRGRLAVDVVSSSGTSVILPRTVFEACDIVDGILSFEILVDVPAPLIEVRTYNEHDLAGVLLSITIEKRKSAPQP